MKNNKYIISISKRTDIPAFYSEWFIDKLKKGYACYRNPFNPKQAFKISLKPEDVIALVFWTRNPEPLMKYMNEIEQFNIPFYFHFTINNFPREIDQSTPNITKTLPIFKKLSERLGTDLILWRYDPIILSSLTNEEWHLNNFEKLCKELTGFTKRCYFSFVDFYKKTERHLNDQSQNSQISFSTKESYIQIIPSMTRRLSEIANSYNIKLYSCAEPILDKLISNNELTNVEKAHCVDFDIISEIYKNKSQNIDVSPTRESCGCFQSRDIGAYDSCMYKCIYCYANLNFEKKSKERLVLHNPISDYLIEENSPIESFIDLTIRPQSNQLDLFR